MNLQQLHDTAALRSYFSRTDTEVWTAITTAGRYVYQAVLKEDRNFFRVLDTTSLTFQPNVQEYTLPADCEQIIRLRERLQTSDHWRWVTPVTPQEPMGNLDYLAPSVNYMGYGSGFYYQGPYLSMADANDGQDDQTSSIYITPIPADTRQVEIMYTAKFLEVASANDNLIIPDNLRDVVLDFAVAELVRGNSDSLAQDYMESGQAKLDMALTLIRDRQIQQNTVTRAYLEEYLY